MALTQSQLVAAVAEKSELSKSDAKRATGAWVVALAERPALRFRKLDLAGQPLGDEGAMAVAQGRLTSLRELWLSGCGIGEAGGRALAASPHLTGLRELFLYHNQLGASLELLRERFGQVLRE